MKDNSPYEPVGLKELVKKKKKRKKKLAGPYDLNALAEERKTNDRKTNDR